MPEINKCFTSTGAENVDTEMCVNMLWNASKKEKLGAVAEKFQSE